MYSRSSEPVSFSRDCAAVLVPQCERVTLPAGSVGYITQALGGSFTVFVAALLEYSGWNKRNLLLEWG